MRIAYLVSQYPAASHTFIRREIQQLRARGFSIESFSIRRPSPAERSSPIDREAYETTCYALPFDLLRVVRAHAEALGQSPLRYANTFRLALEHRVPGAKALLLSIAHFGEAILLAQEMKQREIDHVHNHFANSGANVGYLITRFLGLPWSLTLHGHSETDYPAGPLLGPKLMAADFAVCISYFGMAQAMRTLPPDQWSKLFISRCGLDLTALPMPAPVSRLRPRLVCVGRLAPEKGHVGLLEAFAKARARGANAELVLIGDGEERPRLERRIAELGLGSAVQLRGRLSEPETLAEIAGCDVLVSASFMEGLPVVLMEAMALGLPVIAPRLTGVPELVEHGVHGLLFAPAAWHELEDHLFALITDAELRARLAQSNRARIEAEFDITKAVEPLARRFGEQRGRNENAQAALGRKERQRVPA